MTVRWFCLTDDDSDTFSWFKCVKGQAHEPENLMPTQIIPGKGRKCLIGMKKHSRLLMLVMLY